jgi:uncharacterized protein (TIGR03032 family)
MSIACLTPQREASQDRHPAPAAPTPTAVEFHYTQTDNFANLLSQLNVSLLVTTYQANKLLVVRAAQGGLSTLVRTFDQPMGLAVDGRRLALGTRNQIWVLRNAPDIAPRIEPAGLHDGCFLPRSSHVTGDIRVHEIAWAGDELWIVNTRFSCLCTLDPDYSFVPRWRPPFISALVAEDRCHLNGLAMAADDVGRFSKPSYVTALGETDRGGGWRADKAKGGCLIDVPSGEIVARGLSMPHSPRLHERRLYLLESGTGRLLQVDTVTGHGKTVAELAGFTRGLAIHGPYAFIGLSKIRESNTFGGLPIAERLDELKCGLAVVDLHRGQVVGLLEFQTAVEEIFAVEVLPGVRFPEVLGFQQETIQHTFIVPRECQPVRTQESA